MTTQGTDPVFLRRPHEPPRHGATMASLDALDFSAAVGFNGRLVDWRYTTMAAYFRGRSCLELGSSDGAGTTRLLDHFDSVVAVDGSPRACASLRETVPSGNLEVICSLFEDLDLGRTFDTIAACHVLEHVDSPQHLLDVARRHLAPGGCLIVDVPNADSLHRQLGVSMGLLGHVAELNEADLSIGHQRVYTQAGLRHEVERAGWKITATGGVFLKVLSNQQVSDHFTDEQLLGWRDLGARHPEIASEIYVVAERSGRGGI